MEYSQKTADLIERQCKNIERKDFKLNKSLSEELILKTYDLFNLQRPKKIKWCVDIFEQDFSVSARSAGSAGSALRARSAWSARSARSALSALSAGGARSAWSAGGALSDLSALRARSAWSAWSAWSARSARSAGGAWSARSARSAGGALSDLRARSALDYDFDWYVFEFEYCENPDENKLPNDNDKIYLEYCELLMQAKEAGLGYRIELEDTLYLVPTPLVLIDKQNKFHSEEKPAIRWKKGSEFYYLSGVHFDKSLWKKIVNRKIKPKEILAIKNIEQRMAAIKCFGAANMIKELNAIEIDKKTTATLYKVDKLFSTTEYFISYVCPSTDRLYTKFIPPEIGAKGDAEECRLWGMGLELKDMDRILIET